MFLRGLIQTGHGAPPAQSHHRTYQRKSLLWSCAIVAVAALLFALPAYCLAANSGDENRAANSSANLADNTATDDSVVDNIKTANQPVIAHPLAIDTEAYTDDPEPPIVALGASPSRPSEPVAAPPFVAIAGQPAPARRCFLVLPGLCAAAKNKPIVAVASIQAAALIADGVTTRQYLKRGYVEVDPLTRILIGRRPTWARMAPLGTLQALGGMWLAERMQTSRHSWIRRLWWLPQVAGIAGNTLATANNLRLR